MTYELPSARQARLEAREEQKAANRAKYAAERAARSGSHSHTPARSDDCPDPMDPASNLKLYAKWFRRMWTAADDDLTMLDVTNGFGAARLAAGVGKGDTSSVNVHVIPYERLETPDAIVGQATHAPPPPTLPAGGGPTLGATVDDPTPGG